MTAAEVLKELESLGTEQNRKVYARHGVGENRFGVSFADLGKLQKRIKSDHELALGLWASGNHEARILATMIADPAAVNGKLLDAWVKDLDNYVLTGYFSGLAAKTGHAQRKAEAWMKSKGEMTARAGWLIAAQLAMIDGALADDYCEGLLEVIEDEIHTRKNRVRDAMNSALISIGMRNPRMQKQAIAAAKRIGKVEVDHGETNCKTPDAATYIEKAAARGR